MLFAKLTIQWLLWIHSVSSWIHFYMCISADRRIGMKAENAGAVLLMLNLLKHNLNHAQRATACLLVIQVLSSSGTNTSKHTHVHRLKTKWVIWMPCLLESNSSLMCPNRGTFLCNPQTNFQQQYYNGLIGLKKNLHLHFIESIYKTESKLMEEILMIKIVSVSDIEICVFFVLYRFKIKTDFQKD